MKAEEEAEELTEDSIDGGAIEIWYGKRLSRGEDLSRVQVR